jgi:hypothetical protein
MSQEFRPYFFSSIPEGSTGKLERFTYFNKQYSINCKPVMPDSDELYPSDTYPTLKTVLIRVHKTSLYKVIS